MFWGILWFGLIDLLVVIEQDELFHEHYLLESGWGLLYLVLVAVPLVVLAVRPGQPGRADAAGRRHVRRGAVRGLARLGVSALERARARGHHDRAWWPGSAEGRLVTWRRPDLVLAVLAVLGLPAALRYGAPLVDNTTEVEDITNDVSHYPMQAALALAVVGLVALAAVTRSRLPAWTAAFSALWLGVESVVYPDLPASLGTTGGVLTVAWAVLVVAALEVARRRRRLSSVEEDA